MKSIDSKLFNNMTSLQKLELRVNSLTSLQALTFKHLVSLVYLDLGYNWFESFDQDTFASLHRLEYLNLEHNLLKSFDLTLLRGLGQLDELILTFNRIQTIDTNDLNQLNIRKVKLDNNPVERHLVFVNGSAIITHDYRLKAQTSGSTQLRAHWLFGRGIFGWLLLN